MFTIKPSREIKFKAKQLKGKYCLDPFMSISVDPDGNVGLCSCGFWQPTVIGNIKTHSLNELLHSPLAHRIRQSIRDGTYDYCDETRCGIIINDRLTTLDLIDDQDAIGNKISTRQRVLDPAAVEMPRYFYISGDFVCNLSCPSCRTKVISETEEEAAGRSQLIDLLNQQVFNDQDPRPITIYLSSNGDVFASPRLLAFLQNFAIDRYPCAEFNIQSNGLLFEKRWSKISHLSQNLFNIAITADSHISQTYAKLRRGGKLRDLERNLRFISDLKKTLDFHFSIRMVVQKDNASEIIDFYNWAQQFSVDDVEYMRILDWKTYAASDFQEIDVLDPNHHLFEKTMASLRYLKSQYGSKIVSYHFSLN